MKTFFWKDKSGRGVTNHFSLNELWSSDSDVNWNGEQLLEWANQAEEGDEWENATDYYICTKS